MCIHTYGLHLCLQGAMLSVRCAHSICVYIHIYTCAYIHMADIYSFRVLCSQSGARILCVYIHMYICIHTYIQMCINTYGLHFVLQGAMLSVRCARILYVYPLIEEITLKRFGSRDLSVFPIDLLSDGDCVYSTENLFAILGTPVTACLIYMGTPVKT